MDVYQVIENEICNKDMSIAEAAKVCELPDSTLRGIITRKQKSIALDVAFKIYFGLGIELEVLNGLDQKNPISLPSETNDHQLTDIIEIYNDINDEGKEKLADYASDLKGNPRYKKETQLGMDAKMA